MAQTAVQNDFSKGSLWRIILNQSIPLTVAQLVHVLYNVVDRVYLGHLPGASSLALTGVGLIFPIVALISAFCALFSTGGAPLCAIARGAGEKERAEKLLNNTFSMLLIMAVLMTAAGYLFRRPILYLFGASNDTYAYANDYLKIYLAGTAFSMITTGMNGFINLQGFPKIGMMTTLLGAVLNVILDPVFIFAFDMGVKGAALATVISQAISAIWVLQFLMGKKAILRIRLKYMRPEGKLLKEITTLGIPGFIMSGTNCLVQVTCNATLGLWGGDVYIGVMTVINSIREIFTIPLTGLTQGAQPVISFNYGAKEYDRVRRGIVILSVASISVTTVCWILIMIFPAPVLSLFSNDTALVDVGVRCVRQYFLGFFLQSQQFAGQHSFVALGKSKQAIFFSLLRKVVIVFPLTLLLPHLGGLGVSGVFLAEPVSNLLGGTSCFVTMLLTVWPMLKREEQKLLEQTKA